MRAVTSGLERCCEIGPIQSIGIDTWAVDYGLLDDRGELLSPPHSYRSHRTNDYRSLVDRIGATELFKLNGLQLQPFNTVFQLAVHDRAELDRASRLLWMPELILHELTGVAVTERTSAGSSGLLDIATGGWAPDLLELAGVDPELLGPISAAGSIVGEWRGIPVALVAGHDTASAVVGMGRPGPTGSAFVASGTWILAGVERNEADTSTWAQTANFTNEAGALGGYRFLQNVTGFWLLEQCRLQWGSPPIERLVAEAEKVPTAPIVQVDADVLRSPDDMLHVYTELAGLDRRADPGLVTRSIVESIATRTAEVVRAVMGVEPVSDVVLFGGAARMDLFRRRLADRAGCDVRVGPAEAAALGNALVQGIAIEEFASLEEARSRL